ncbi:hypothetical protein [Pedobacter antarcticus]|uniref:hypothetical protein n=1 Tax=Pedobacter antarcticus TaxID=34086 RepID=UPI00292CB2B9|nr:hypothetical protein [Pedobacter antarcticus]
MITVNSLSGGKTSSYLAAHYPADIEVFALCCIDDHNAGKGIDKKLMQMANDKLQIYCSHQNEFVATSEDPVILKTMFDLEQHLGREIIWLRGMGWEDMMRIKNAIPNIDKRFCTTIMKMIPIFEFLYMYHELPVQMRVGYRYDEMERATKFTDKFKMSTHCEIYGDPSEVGSNKILQNALKFNSKVGLYTMHRWTELTWRIGDFVLIDNKIVHPMIIDYWEDKGIEFAKDSNCQNCFWKQEQQLRKNYDTNPDIMKWAAVQEVIYDHTFKENYSLLEIERMGIQMDFFFGTGSGCQAGFCTD